VQPGHTLWEIARAYETSVDAIMEANELTPKDVRLLREGAELRIPGVAEVREVTSAKERADKLREELPPVEDGAYHFLQEGETLWDLARIYDKSLDAIMAANEFSDSDARALRPGSPVAVPGIDESEITHETPAKKSGQRGLRHTLAPGETIWDLAHAFHVSTAEIMSANGLTPEEVRRLREGQTLRIPGVTKREDGKVRRSLSPRQRRAQARARRLGLGTRRAAKQLLHGRTKKRWIEAAGGQARFPGTLRWPVTNGWYVRGYGSGAGGYHLAVDIMGEIGWNVRSAARGIVAYSGDGIRGYGNVVMVLHPGGWVTMYAHNSVNFVVAGEKVPRGAILAEVGSTGISRGPHVHFELIYDHRNCDPATLFRPGIRHRDGDRADVPREVWRQPSRRPDEVACDRRRRHPKSRWVVHEDPESDS
jgi:murein DD-endopeptidase MepM/ murein hydrolase activator NlpD